MIQKEIRTIKKLIFLSVLIHNTLSIYSHLDLKQNNPEEQLTSIKGFHSVCGVWFLSFESKPKWKEERGNPTDRNTNPYLLFLWSRLLLRWEPIPWTIMMIIRTTTITTQIRMPVLGFPLPSNQVPALLLLFSSIISSISKDDHCYLIVLLLPTGSNSNNENNLSGIPPDKRLSSLERRKRRSMDGLPY